MSIFTKLDSAKAYVYKYTPTQSVGTLNAGNFMVPDTWEHSENGYTDVWGVPKSHCVSISRIPISSSLLISLKDTSYENILGYLINKDRYLTEKNGGSYMDVQYVNFAGRRARYTKSTYKRFTSIAYFYMTETHVVMVSATYKTKSEQMAEYLLSILNTYTRTSTDCVPDWISYDIPTRHDPIDNIYKCHGLCNPELNTDDIHLCQESEIFSLFTSIYESKSKGYRKAACVSYIRFLCNKYNVPQSEVYFSDATDYAGLAYTNDIVINVKRLSNRYYAFDTCAHEARHIWQHEQVRLGTTIGKFFEEVKRHYVPYEEDCYLNQLSAIESDARRFAASELSRLKAFERSCNI